MKRRRIGISGFMGAGKSTCAGFFLDALKGDGVDVTLIDADAEAKAIMRTDKAIQKKLVESFGEAVMSGGEIVFSLLGSLAFSSMSHLLALNRIVHPQLLKRLKGLIFSKGSAFVICDAALIPFWHVEEWFDALFWVQAPFKKRYCRLMNKVRITPDALTARMELQQLLVTEPRQAPWTIFTNQGTIEELKPHLLSLCAKMKGA
jgi:dephospho-CoA kinase